LLRGLVKDVREQFRERRRERPLGPCSGVESFKRHRRVHFRHPRRRGTAVVILPVLRVPQNLVRLLNLAVHLLGDAVPGIHTRLIAARETTKRALDLVGRSRPRYAEKGVEIHGRYMRCAWCAVRGAPRTVPYFFSSTT